VEGGAHLLQEDYDHARHRVAAGKYARPLQFFGPPVSALGMGDIFGCQFTLVKKVDSQPVIRPENASNKNESLAGWLLNGGIAG
jgi:hypothetical protein